MRTLFHPMRSRPMGMPSHRAALAACAMGALLALAGPATAARNAAADAQYQRERAACLNGQTHQDRDTCLREAAAAHQESRRGGLDTNAADFERNRSARCEPLPPALREDCQRRMHGEGTTSGSVEQGGIYRELRTTVPSG